MTENQGGKFKNWYANYHSDDRSRWMSTEAPVSITPPARPGPSTSGAMGGGDEFIAAELARQTDHLEAIRRYVGIMLAIVIVQIAIAFLFVVSVNR